VSWLLPPGCLCCDQKALSESHQVIRRPLARLPPCFAKSVLFVSRGQIPPFHSNGGYREADLADCDPAPAQKTELIRAEASEASYRRRQPRLCRGSRAVVAHGERCGRSGSLSRHYCRQRSPGPSPCAAASQVATPAVSAEGGVDLMLPPHSDHQSKCVLHSLFLGCVSRGLLGFSHEDIIDFDICTHAIFRVVCINA
jgi:hypothetical protein